MNTDCVMLLSCWILGITILICWLHMRIERLEDKIEKLTDKTDKKESE